MLQSRSASRKSARKSRATRRQFLGLDPLEMRALLSVTFPTPKTATYTDLDGDTVTVAITVGTLSSANFDVTAVGNTDQLNDLDLTTGGNYGGTNVTITVAKRGANGDGLVNVGRIDATGMDLGTVTINGDLGSIDAGDNSALKPAIKSLTVRTMGRLGLASQGGSGTLASDINGTLAALTVKGDMQDASIIADGSANGKIGTATIAGSLIGGAADHTGQIFATFSIASIKIAGDLQGGGGLDSGSITAGDGIGVASIGGSLYGSSGDDSGAIVAGGVGTVTIAGDLRGRSGTFSGGIDSGSGIGVVKIGGSVVGGTGTSSGEIFAATAIKSIAIAHNLAGSSGLSSGSIQANSGIGTVTIGGSLVGNSGVDSGFVSAGANLNTISIKGDIRGASATSSGAVQSGGVISSVSVGGSVVGGSAVNSGQIVSSSDIIKAAIAGDIRGGSAAESGQLVSTLGQIVTVTVGDSLFGGGDQDTGAITAGTSIGSVKIAEDIHGGSGLRSGFVGTGTGKLAAITVGGSIFGGSANQSGEIFSGGDMGIVTVGGSLVGNGNSGTASLDQTGAIISTGRLTTVNIGGSIFSGANIGSGALTASGTVRAGEDIGAFSVKGSLIGNQNSTASTPVIISAGGLPVGATDVAIAKFTVGGHVEDADILGGYNTVLAATSADAQIGAVTDGGDWVDSSLVAGASNTSGIVNFGDANDAKISGAGVTDNASVSSKIASVTINGYVYGSPLVSGGATNFGFVAESIGVFKFGGVTLPAQNAITRFLIQPTSNVDIDIIS